MDHKASIAGQNLATAESPVRWAFRRGADTAIGAVMGAGIGMFETAQFGRHATTADAVVGAGIGALIGLLLGPAIHKQLAEQPEKSSHTARIAAQRELPSTIERQ